MLIPRNWQLRFAGLLTTAYGLTLVLLMLAFPIYGSASRIFYFLVNGVLIVLGLLVFIGIEKAVPVLRIYLVVRVILLLSSLLTIVILLRSLIFQGPVEVLAIFAVEMVVISALFFLLRRDSAAATSAN